MTPEESPADFAHMIPVELTSRIVHSIAEVNIQAPVIRCAQCGMSRIPLSANSCPGCSACHGWAQIQVTIGVR
jgi:hypothetical protein